MVAYGRWSLTRSGHYERVDCIMISMILINNINIIINNTIIVIIIIIIIMVIMVLNLLSLFDVF